MLNFEKDGYVSVWANVHAKKGRKDVDILKTYCGVKYYDLDCQECILAEDGVKAPIRSLLRRLSYATTFIDNAMKAASQNGISTARWVLAQFEFAYDPAAVPKKALKDSCVDFLGCFPYDHSPESSPAERLLREPAENLADLADVSFLQLATSKVTDAHLKKLTVFKELNSLLLHYTKISDKGLENVQGLKQLRNLSLDQTRITDAGLENLQGLARLEKLSLRNTKITDAGVAAIKGLKTLKRLDLSETSITDAGLSAIKGLKNIERLNLDKTTITDAGLKHLAGMARLEGLSVTDCKKLTLAGLLRLNRFKFLSSLSLGAKSISDADLERLKKALPNCRIDAGREN